MDIPLNSIATGAATSGLLSGIQGISFAYASAAIGLTALFLSGFEVGRNAIYRILWWIDGLFGGAPHTVSLPGPTGLPIVGNIYQMRHGHVAKLAEWAKKYGDVFRVSIGNREVIFLNSNDALAKTVVQQGPAYQSRPIFKLFHSEYASSGIYTVGTSPWSNRLSRTRKAMSTQITPRLLPSHIPVIFPRLKKLLKEIRTISEGPSHDIGNILHQFGTGQVCEQFMGTTLDDELVEMFATNETKIFRLRTMGSPASDYIPLLEGAGTVRRAIGKTLGIKSWSVDQFKENAREARRVQQIYTNKMLDDLRERIENGDETPSILGNILRQKILTDEEVLLASYTGIAAGVNVGYSLTWTLTYLANRPDLQKAGYEAIQEVYGGEPPEPYEFDRVELVKALHMEGSRMFAPVRLGFPRETLKGATYNGQEIPEGMVVIMNSMAANRDPVAFDRPNEFLPERWMDNRKGRTDSFEKGGEKVGVSHLTYGCGRRVCPGFEMANRGLYSSIVLLLHFFTWERQPLGEAEKKKVFPTFRAARECSLEVDAVKDTATPTEAQAIPFSAGIKFTCRDPEGFRNWIESEA